MALVRRSHFDCGCGCGCLSSQIVLKEGHGGGLLLLKTKKILPANHPKKGVGIAMLRSSAVPL